jgi:small GTP-binding protein
MKPGPEFFRMNNRAASRSGKLKIVVFGPYHVGKSSFIQSIDPLARHTEARTGVGDHTTIAIDFGRTTILGRKIYLFGTPGQGRFEFVRDFITRGLDGALLLIDATVGLETMHHDIHLRLKKEGVPMAFLVNKCDYSTDNRAWREILKEESVHEISALDPVSSRRALEYFVKEIADT